MKKTIKKFQHIHYMAIILAVLLGSCNNDDKDLKAPSAQGVSVVNGRLAFSNLDQFETTIKDINNGKAKITDGRLAGLNYSSYLNVTPGKKSPEFITEIMDIFEYQILLNENGEVQIGDKVYQIKGDESKMLGLDGTVLEVSKNEISRYNPDTKKFESLKEHANERSFGVFEDAYINVIPNPNRFIVRFAFLRSTAGFFPIEYRYQASLLDFYVSKSGTWVRDISDCDACAYPTSNPYGGTTNAPSITYYCGANSVSNEANNGVNLRASYTISYSTFFSNFSITHQLVP